jgi:hypothetical protein
MKENRVATEADQNVCDDDKPWRIKVWILLLYRFAGLWITFISWLGSKMWAKWKNRQR